MADTSKTVTMRVNKKDVRKISAAVLEAIIHRMRENSKTQLMQVSSLLHSEEGSAQEILEELRKYLDVLSQAQNEVNDAAVLIMNIHELPTDTEVLEDLPDLEEDGLGIDSGSE